MQLKVDAGAQANLSPRSLFNRLGTKQKPYPQGVSCVIMGVGNYHTVGRFASPCSYTSDVHCSSFLS